MFKKGLVVCALAAVMTMEMTAAAFAGSSDAFSVYPVNGGSGYDNIDGPEAPRKGEWRKYSNGKWAYQYPNGTWAANWCFLDYKGRGDWYYFDEKGWMQTGWLTDNSGTYYLQPESDGQQGRMYVGEHIIDGKSYRFETRQKHWIGHLLKEETKTEDESLKIAKPNLKK